MAKRLTRIGATSWPDVAPLPLLSFVQKLQSPLECVPQSRELRSHLPASPAHFAARWEFCPWMSFSETSPWICHAVPSAGVTVREGHGPRCPRAVSRACRAGSPVGRAVSDTDAAWASGPSSLRAAAPAMCRSRCSRLGPAGCFQGSGVLPHGQGEQGLPVESRAGAAQERWDGQTEHLERINASPQQELVRRKNKAGEGKPEQEQNGASGKRHSCCVRADLLGFGESRSLEETQPFSHLLFWSLLPLLSSSSLSFVPLQTLSHLSLFPHSLCWFFARILLAHSSHFLYCS